MLDRSHPMIIALLHGHTHFLAWPLKICLLRPCVEPWRCRGLPCTPSSPTPAPTGSSSAPAVLTWSQTSIDSTVAAASVSTKMLTVTPLICPLRFIENVGTVISEMSVSVSVSWASWLPSHAWLTAPRVARFPAFWCLSVSLVRLSL